MFLDIFGPPDHDSDIHLPPKYLVPALANLLIFAVRHCIVSGIITNGAASMDVVCMYIIHVLFVI